MAGMALLVLISGIQDAIAARKLYAVPLRGGGDDKPTVVN